MDDESGRRFEALLTEAAAVDVRGWDFSWFTGRATEGRPSWGYQRVLAARLAAAHRSLDLQTGDGEVLAGALALADHRRRSSDPPRRVHATEEWAPNRELATTALGPWEATVVAAPAAGPIPLPSDDFDLVSCRHPVVLPWDEVARLLAGGGRSCAQHVGVDSVGELSRALLGPFEVDDSRAARRAVDAASTAGLRVERLEEAASPMTFDDIAAVVVFLRKVIWIVPDFTVERFRPQLWALHRDIERDGPFRATSTRYLIECAKT